MRKCPLNRFEKCIGNDCPFFNRKMDACILPRLVLAVVKKSELKEELNYEPTRK